MAPQEVATGWLTGFLPEQVTAVSTGSALRALEDAIRPALARPPCVVEFSGGRDSSVVLAVATSLARREGLPDPLPFTCLYPDLPEADESEWQEAVIRHLDIGEWERLASTGEVDLLGSLATSSMSRWGLLWPPTAHTRATQLGVARGGSLLSGEGGDEVLGPRRISVVRQLLVGAIRPSTGNVRLAALALAPRPVRTERLRRRFAREVGAHWLTQDGRDAFFNALSADAASEPLDWRMAVRRHPRTRAVGLAMETLDILAEDIDVMRINPLLDAGFLDAVCRAGGWRGFVGRTAALLELFGSVLPESVLTRNTKARFNRAVFGEQSRAFVQEWDGSGVDTSLVDADRLRDEWMADEPHALTFPLLHSCWLSAHG
jgi:asparagine synthase (glutamine-hydrolysing)